MKTRLTPEEEQRRRDVANLIGLVGAILAVMLVIVLTRQ